LVCALRARAESFECGGCSATSRGLSDGPRIARREAGDVLLRRKQHAAAMLRSQLEPNLRL
jgi:hypothetical protein